jgi:hypothetical protein
MRRLGRVGHQRTMGRHASWLAFPALLALTSMMLVLAACGAATPSGMPSDTQAPDATAIAPSGWKTYTNTAYHYAIQYPANWFLADSSQTADYQEIYNFDPNQLDNAEDVPPPPYNKYSIDAYANPKRLAMPDFYADYRATDSSTPPANSQQQRAVSVAGQSALQVVQRPVDWSGGSIKYASVTYFVPDGDSVLILAELYSPGSGPSDVFGHMIGSLKIGS